ncbi:DNA mismatch repair protein MutT [Spongiactinospora rosea]|uniref:DNA mismatch repair protein MutT n=1 Tax=Spongiactinospora rosea TaxID=2248750 RepID=A0A366LSL3_9ACTN|nr:NUDIX domain-containing protein [Spongiactinospora rosea]RBQ16945.1 DNA mismatch repair protein MutT [Spongiactinospora rosea]
MTDTALPAALDSHTLLVAAVIVHDTTAGHVLLLQRASEAKFAAGHWDLPVGKADKGEVITATAARELREETGLVADPGHLKVAGLIHGAWGVEAPNGFLTVVFVAHQWEGRPVNAEPHKHSRVMWVPVDEIPVPFVPTTRDALVNYLRGGPMVATEGF